MTHFVLEGRCACNAPIDPSTQLALTPWPLPAFLPPRLPACLPCHPQALQSRNAILEGLNGELQAQLMTKEREVERLKVALDVAAERSLGSHPGSPRWGTGLGNLREWVT